MPASSIPPRAPRPVFGAACLVGILATGGVLGACSSSDNSAGKNSTTTVAPSTTTSDGSDLGQFRALSAELQAGKHATFKAVYTSHDASGTSRTITIEQKPPRSVISTSSGTVINDGTHTYFCSAGGGSQQCVSESTAGSNPLASIVALFDPTTLLNSFQAAEEAAGSHELGYSAAFSSATYAGVHARCVHYTSTATRSVTYCVTNSGILAYAQSAGGTFELTGFSSAPPASDFTLPAGATVVTIPTVSIPGAP